MRSGMKRSSWTGGTPGDPASACRATVSSASATSVTGIVVTISPVGCGPEQRLEGLKIVVCAAAQSCLSNGFASRVAMRSDADLGSLQRPAPPTASCGYNDSDAHLLAVGHTVGQQTRTVRDMSDLAHAPDATVAAVQGQRFCPDTEEVTGSNPVSPTLLTRGSIPKSERRATYVQDSQPRSPRGKSVARWCSQHRPGLGIHCVGANPVTKTTVLATSPITAADIITVLGEAVGKLAAIRTDEY